MNSLVEHLNRWGADALALAWPMLWQSSLLVVVLFALDFALRRKVRAAIRYAFWLVLLVKLVLPPTLALPTGASWWLRPAAAAPVAAPRVTTVVVSQPAMPLPAIPLPARPAPVSPAMPPPPESVSLSGLALLAWGIICLGLLGWLLARWSGVARRVRRALPMAHHLDGLLGAGEQALELPPRVRLRLADGPISPAVCGLIRPVILLPRSLVDDLTPAQLRAVLLHELAHLRRGDVWVNCAQALLQLVYWWHPLLWLANARIRRLREEAVDDAVMLALRAEAHSYAPTLLEVAKLAFHRPLAGLGLVGILESKKALRQRIERLIDFRPPRRAGLSFASILCVLAFGALAVPMGEAPAKSAGLPRSSPAQAADPTTQAANAERQAASAQASASAANLLTRIFRIDADVLLAVLRQREGPTATATPEGRQQAIRNLLSAAGADLQAPEAVTFNDGNGMLLVLATSQKLTAVEALAQALNSAAERIRSTGVNGSDFEAAVAYSFGPQAIQAVKQAADMMNSVPSAPQTVANRAARSTDGPRANYQTEVLGLVAADTNLYTRTFKVDANTCYQALERVGALKSDERLTGNGRLVTGGLPQFNPLPGVPVTDYGGQSFTPQTNSSQGMSAALRNYFSSLGVDLATPKAIFFSEGRGMLLVRATKADLDKIEAAIQVLNTPPPQVHIKVRFVEVPQDESRAKGYDWYLGNILMANTVAANAMGIPPHTNAAVFPGGVPIAPAAATGAPLAVPAAADTNGAPVVPTLTGILTEPQFKIALQALAQRQGVRVLAEPSLVMLSGRQGQVKTTEIRTIVSGVNTNQMEFGPVFDVVPIVLPDGCMINLNLTASLTEFLGYTQVPAGLSASSSTRERAVPVITTRHASANVTVWDGRTCVLGLAGAQEAKEGAAQTANISDAVKKNLLIFVTPTIVDPAGNRVHSD